MGGSKFHGLLTFFPSLSSLNTKGPLSVLVFFFSPSLYPVFHFFSMRHTTIVAFA